MLRETKRAGGGPTTRGSRPHRPERPQAWRAGAITVLVSLVAGLLAYPLPSARSDETGGVGTWSPARPMVVPRIAHEATRLDGPDCRAGSPPPWCGHVLVVTGQAFESFGASELYDPRNDQWTATRGGLHAQHGGGHTATLLEDGRVLVVGGNGAPNGAPEIYDPDEGTWSPTSPIRPVDLRGSCQAATGPDIDDAPWPDPLRPDDACELASTADTLAISGHVAVRLDGPACRSESRAAYCGKVLVAGSTALQPAAREPAGRFALLYDPIADRWERTAPTLDFRLRATAALLDGPPCHQSSPPPYCGTVVVAGGGNQYGQPAADRTAEVYDPAAATWTPTGPLAASVGINSCTEAKACNAAAPLPDGEVLVIGGSDVAEYFKTTVGCSTATCGRMTQRYDPLTRKWRLAAQTSSMRLRATLTALADGRVLAAGGAPGANASGTLLASAEIYDHSSDTWTAADDLIVPRGRHSATLLADGRVLVAGGRQVVGTHFDGTVLAETFDVSGSDAPPAVVGVEPSVGPASGGTAVTIRGRGFSAVSRVRFGTADAASYVVQGDDKVVAVAPAHPPERVEITVTTFGDPPRTSLGGSHATFTFASDTITWRATRQTPITSKSDDLTATLLAGRGCEGEATAGGCGKVLVVDGAHNGKPELYDPATETWVHVESQGGARYQHTATALPSGRVLLAGGRPGGDASGLPMETAEIYDPASGSFKATGSLTTARARHTATPLSPPLCSGSQPPTWCGKVLVVGGRTPGPDHRQLDNPACEVAQDLGDCDKTVDINGWEVVASSAELYDPRTGAWQPVPSMQAARVSHSATLLAEGRVLVAGGVTGDETLASAEVYDPASNTWTTVDDMGFRRRSHTATLLEGRACAAPAAPAGCGKVLVSGGGPGRVADELYDPHSGTWTRTGTPLEFRVNHTAALLPGGTVLAAGGAVSVGATESAELYDPATGSWSITASMREPRASHAAVLLEDGDVLVVGGRNDGSELYDQTAPPPTPVISRVEPAVVASGPTSGDTTVTLFGRAFPLDASVYFGDRAGVVRFASPEKMEVRPPPDHPQGTVVLTVRSSSLASGPVPFTFWSGRWSESGAPLDTGDGTGGGRYQHTASRLGDGSVLVAGGTTQFFGMIGAPPYRAVALSSAQVYDPTTQAWRATSSMTVGRFSHAATTLGDGKVLVTGGQGEFGVALPSAEVYDPQSGTWSTAAPMLTARFSHTATVLRDGRVLVAGGAFEEASRARATSAVEIYDPRHNRWTQADSLDEARASHTATLVGDGSVLVAGGMKRDPHDPAVDTIQPDGFAASSAERYDTATGRWERVDPLGVARFEHAATVLSGRACAHPSAMARCGMVVVSGGTAGGAEGLDAAELYDPATRTWTATGSLRRSRGGHSAVGLEDGRVLVAGSGARFPGEPVPPATASSEVYDPLRGEWSLTSPMATLRAGHTATGMEDGTVLVAGGYSTIAFGDPAPDPLDKPLVCCNVHDFAEVAEVYTPAPTVASTTPTAGPVAGGTAVTLGGLGLDRATAVRFDGVPSPFQPRSASELVATAPPHTRGRAGVEAIGPGGTSASLDPLRHVHFVYRGAPGAINGLVAEALSDSAIALSFAAADDGSGGEGLATAYMMRQSDAEIRSEEDFAAAAALCGGVCRLAKPGLAVRFDIDSLDPGRTYHYAVRAVNDDGEVGPLSSSVQATTFAVHHAGGSRCPAAEAGAGLVRYQGGAYSLVGLPAGTVVGANSPLYGWFNQGAGGAYQTVPSSQPVEAGRGYWAWFSCPQVVALAGPGSASESLPLAGYHASMVGNPSAASPASVSGHDFAAGWDPSLNSGAGGYSLSGYREAQGMAVGEGLWVFSYVDTQVRIEAG